MEHAVIFIPIIPLFSALFLICFGKKLGEPLAGWIATIAVGASFVASLITWIGVLGSHGIDRTFIQHLFNWLPVGSFQVQMAFQADPLSVTMALFVSGVSALIHLYSIEYMHGDKDFPKFFIYLNLFVASMLILVLGANLLITFLGWEGVGVCSYFLISFWFERPKAATAGKKAMIVNRIADVGFLMAMFLAFQSIGSLNYSNLISSAPHISHTTLSAIVVLAFVGAMGKSAQFPLFGWLADAMEGPTPVSALIHAATMVTAGVFLMVRLSPLLALAPGAAHFITIIGIITAFVAAAAGTSQNDIKKVLAYSTVSQLGYMFIGVGSGAYVAAIFLMVTHAFYKALLFLSAGSVIHGMNDEQDLKAMGALRALMPMTALAFFVGWMAIAGVPPFAGFFSKGDVLLGAYQQNIFIWLAGVITAGLTSYYMGREFCLAFLGKRRWEEKPKVKKSARSSHAVKEVHPHDPGFKMLGPILLLACLAVIGGLLNLPFASSLKVLEHWLAPSLGVAPAPLHAASSAVQWVLAVVDAIVALGGGYIAFAIWSKKSKHPELEPVFLQNAWYIDATGDTVIAKSGTKLAEISADVIEPVVIDGAVVGIVNIAKFVGVGLHRIASGFVRREALIIAGGTVTLLLAVGIRGGW